MDFFRKVFGKKARLALDVREVSVDAPTAHADTQPSEKHVRPIPSFSRSFSVLGGKIPDQRGGFVARDEPYPPGHRIGGMHKVVEVLGGPEKTGMGIVYVCERYGDASLFVLKTFQDRFLRDARIREEFQREAVNHVRLGWHPHTVTANTVLILDGRPFVDLLYVPPDSQGRRTLADHLAAMRVGQPFPPELAGRLAIEICHGMEHAAALGVTPHQDLKPGNILVAEGLSAKVADFGLARAAEATFSGWSETAARPRAIGSVTSVRTKRGVRVVGTPPWMSPEHFDGHTDQRSDIYALGIILFQMVCGRYPYRSADWEHAHRTEPVPQFDSPFAAIVHRALAKSPDRRHQSFGEMRQDLEVAYRDVTGKDYPSLARALHGMGLERNCLGGWSEPGAIDHLLNLAMAFHALGQDDQAEPLLRRVLQMEPDSALAHSSLALVLRQRGATQEALSHFECAAKRRRSDPLLLHNMATTYLCDGRYNEALPLLDQAMKLDNALPGLWADNALCLEVLGAHEQALATVESALKQAPRDPKGWLLKAQILIAMKEGPRALQALAEAHRVAATSDIAQLCQKLKQEATALAKPSDPKHGFQTQGSLDPATLTPLEFPYTIPLPRERQEQLRSLLHGLKRPSQQITTAELAAAVTGGATGPLSAWAQDRRFENELEELLESDMVWICLDCDGIIGFLDTPPGEPHGRLVRDLMLVHSRDQLGCPVCGSKAMVLYNPQALRYGQKLDIKETLTKWTSQSMCDPQA